MRSLIILGVVVVIGLILLRQSLYVVDETEQVIILRFNEVINTRTDPGLYVKAPFVDTVVTFDKRVLRIDATPVAMPDKEKQNLIIDSYARYKIVDPVQFRKTLQTQNNARSRLGDIVTSTLRDRVALRDRFEIIGAEPIVDDTGNPVEDDEGLPLFEGRTTRNEILQEVLDGVKRRTQEQDFGIAIIDVRIKRADFPESVTPSIYTRMRAERNRIATRFRAEGEEEDLKIRAVANREREVILATAEQESNQIRGDGEGEAIRILASALNLDPEFFAFRRSLEAYQKIFSSRDTVILSSEEDLFKFLSTPAEASN
jgi:membrane protease subunit HflC